MRVPDPNPGMTREAAESTGGRLEGSALPTNPLILAGTRPKYVYVASSWRNPIHVAVCAALRACEIDHYDFKNPEGATGFKWTEVMEHFSIEEQTADMDEYLSALLSPRATQGFHADYDAMQKADCCVLVLPCGRSAHLELGWMAGQFKRTAILLDPDGENLVTPELMYKLCDYVAPSLFDLLGWLGVED